MPVTSRKTGIFLFASFFLALALLAPRACPAEGPGGPGWEKRSNGKNYNTYMRQAPGSDTAEMKLVGEISAAPAQVFAVVTDYPAFPQFMPYMDYTKVIDKKEVNDKENIYTVFFYVKPPFISPRYYTIKLTDEKDPDNIAGAFRSAWEQDNGNDRLTPSAPSLKGKLEDADEAVETKFNRGCWFLQPGPGGKGTQVTYYVYSNPGGSVPSWVANRANTVALPKLWKALVERCNKLYP